MKFARIKLTFLITTVFGLLSFVRKLFDELATDGDDLWQVILLEELTGVWMAAFLLLPIIELTFRKPPWSWPKWLVYIPYAVVFCITHTLSMYASRNILFPALGLGNYEYGDLTLRFIMEAPIQLMIFSAMMLVLYVMHQGEITKKAESMKTQLAQQQMQALQHQLAPHFLFNILNTISNKVYESPEKADKLIGMLAEVLRELLNNSEKTVINLDKELALVHKYIELQKHRYEDRINFNSDIHAKSLKYQVPALILQPLIENIFKHGQSQTGMIDIIITTELSGQNFMIKILDNGPGLQKDAPIAEGIGIKNIRKRLEIIYSNMASLRFESNDNKGTMVILELPKCV